MTDFGWKPNAAQKVARARSELQKAHADLAALSRDYSTAVRQVRPTARANRDLSPEGQAKAIADGNRRAREAAEARLAALRAKVQDAESTLQEVRQTEPVADVASLARREAHWRRAQSLLDARMSIPNVIANTTDPEALLALREELPTYVLARTAQRSTGRLADALAPQEGADISQVLLSVDRRLAEVTEGDAATFAAARVALHAELPTARTHADGVARELSGTGSPLATAMAVQMAGGAAPVD